MKKTTLVQAYSPASVLVVPTSVGSDFGMPARVRTTGAPIQAFVGDAGVTGTAPGTRTWSPPIT